MLKNKKEREEYIRDENNWEILEYSLTSAGGVPIVVKDHSFPKVQLKRLKGTNLCKIGVLVKPNWYADKPHYVEIGCKVFEDNGMLHSVYDLTINQQIDYLAKL